VLFEYTHEIFSELVEEAAHTSQRIRSLSERVVRLSDDAPLLDRAAELQDLGNRAISYSNPSEEVACQYLPENRAAAITKQYEECMPPPNLGLLDEYAGDSCLKKYTNPMFFLETWIEEQEKMYKEAKRKRARRRKGRARSTTTQKKVVKQVELSRAKYSSMGQEFSDVTPSTATSKPTPAQPSSSSSAAVVEEPDSEAKPKKEKRRTRRMTKGKTDKPKKDKKDKPKRKRPDVKNFPPPDSTAPAPPTALTEPPPTKPPLPPTTTKTIPPPPNVLPPAPPPGNINQPLTPKKKDLPPPDTVLDIPPPPTKLPPPPPVESPKASLKSPRPRPDLPPPAPAAVPSAPAPPPAPTTNSGGGASLAAALQQKSTNLQHRETPSSDKKPKEARSALLESIHKGTQLRKVTPDTKKPQDNPYYGGFNVAKILSRRAAMEFSDDEGSFDDDDWED